MQNLAENGEEENLDMDQGSPLKETFPYYFMKGLQPLQYSKLYLTITNK